MWSKALKGPQQGYSTYKRELLAIKLAMRHFNKDIQGRRLCIFTDHRPLIGSFASPDLQAHDPQALNAINEISQFTSDIRHKPGSEIPIADWLSRHPIIDETDKTKTSFALTESGGPGQGKGDPSPPPYLARFLVGRA